MRVQIIPSILTPDKKAFIKRYRTVSRYCRIAQLDVLDKSLVPYRDFCDPYFIDSLHPRMKFEVHLMTRALDRNLPKWNYSWVEKIIFHKEAATQPAKIIQMIKRMKKQAGVAINPATPARAVESLLGLVDTALVMTVYPGRNAAPFVPAAVKKIQEIRRADNRVNLEVDGGINPKTARRCIDAGANLLVVGSYLEDRLFRQRLAELKKAVSARSNIRGISV